MESEIGGHRSPLGGPGSEPSSQELQPVGGEALSRAAERGSEATGPLTESRRKDDATERSAEIPDQREGGESLTAGRGGESEQLPGFSGRAKMRGLNFQMVKEAHDVVLMFAQHSGLQRNHFLSAALMIGATSLIQQLRPDVKPMIGEMIEAARGSAR